MEKEKIRVKVDIFYDAKSLLKSSSNLYQLLFLDVQLGETNGIDVARELRKQQVEALIIYVSAYIEMAPMGYEVKAFRYILKRDIKQVLPYTIMEAIAELKKNEQMYEIKTQRKIIRVPVKDILYIESYKRYVVIHTLTGDYEQYKKIGDLEEELEEFGFCRVYKSYLVNINHIVCFEANEVIMDNGVKLRCGETYHQKAIQQYVLWKGME